MYSLTPGPSPVERGDETARCDIVCGVHVASPLSTGEGSVHLREAYGDRRG